LITVSCICSTVVKRFSQAGQVRRRRIADPSSATRESSTRVSVLRQKGQCIRGSSHGWNGRLGLWIPWG
jgi:hypothetical protein